MMIQIIFAFFSILSFGIIFEIKGKNLFFSGIAGGLTWGVYLLMNSFGQPILFSYFVASMVLTLYSEIFARILKTPVTSILISGLLALVPGSGIYYTMYFLVYNEVQKAVLKGLETLFMAGALSFGIVVVTSLIRLFKTGERNRYTRFKEHHEEIQE